MSTIPIPDGAVGRVGMVAALKKVNESDTGKLVLLIQPAGMLTALVGSPKPVFSWIAQAIGEPVECQGKPTRSIYVADQCLVPVTEMSEKDAELIAQKQARSDFDAALQELKALMEAEDVTASDLDQFLEEAAERAFFERSLELVSVQDALREIGFYTNPEAPDCLSWVAANEGIELKFQAGERWIANWVIWGTAVTPRQAIWDERVLPSEAPRGKIASTVLGIWRSAFPRAAVPGCLLVGEIYERHQLELRKMNIRLPSLSVAPKVFRQILKWLEPEFGYSSPNDLVTLSYHDGLLKINNGGNAFGCPACGEWVDECQVHLADLINLRRQIIGSRYIRLEQSSDHIVVNGCMIEIHSKGEN